MKRGRSSEGPGRQWPMGGGDMTTLRTSAGKTKASHLRLVKSDASDIATNAPTALRSSFGNTSRTPQRHQEPESARSSSDTPEPHDLTYLWAPGQADKGSLLGAFFRAMILGMSYWGPIR